MFFGRLCSLWGVVGSKYRWSEANYDPISRLCLALKNAHVRVDSLRCDDLDFYQRFKNRKNSIRGELLEKRKLRQERYCRRR